jgi:hypothetical protein
MGVTGGSGPGRHAGLAVAGENVVGQHQQRVALAAGREPIERALGRLDERLGPAPRVVD